MGFMNQRLNLKPPHTYAAVKVIKNPELYDLGSCPIHLFFVRASGNLPIIVA